MRVYDLARLQLSCLWCIKCVPINLMTLGYCANVSFIYLSSLLLFFVVNVVVVVVVIVVVVVVVVVVVIVVVAVVVVVVLVCMCLCFIHLFIFQKGQ